MWYSPYFGSRNSSIRNCIASDDGRTKQRHRRCRIFSRSALSNRLHSDSQYPTIPSKTGVGTNSIRYTSWPRRVDWVIAVDTMETCSLNSQIVAGHRGVIFVRTDRFAVEEEDLHLAGGASGSIRGHHLAQVIGYGEYDIHGWRSGNLWGLGGGA